MITSDTKKVVNFICKKILEISKEKEFVVLAVPGGRSVKNIYSMMKTHNEIPWNKIHLFMVDERLVSIDHPESNFRLVTEQFVGELVATGKLFPHHLHPFKIDLGNDDYGIKMYEEELKKYGGVFDIVILGVGEDAHVAGLYPNHTIKNESDYFFVFHDSPKPPKERMTASRKLLLKSKLAIALFLGEGKKKAYEMYKDSQLTINDCPVKLIDKLEKSIVLTDLR